MTGEPDEQTDQSIGPAGKLTDIEETSGSRLGELWQPLLVGVLLVVIIAILVGSITSDEPTVTLLGYEMAGLTAAYVGSLLTLAVLVGPTVSRPHRIRAVGRRLRTRPLLVGSAGYVIGLGISATVYGLTAGQPRVEPLDSLQPPVWGSISTVFVPECAGSVSGEVCHGSLTYPLGTNPSGQGLLEMTLLGVNTSLQVAVTASVIAVTLGVVVGTITGYSDNRWTELLLRYVDVQQSVPVFFVYVLLLLVFDRSYPLMVLVFGLLSWGGIARIIRGEVTQRREEAYIKAATLSGAPTGRILRRHILPNASNTIITAAAVLFSKFVVYEAALAFLSLTDPTVVSLGNELARAVGTETADPIARGQGSAPPWNWQEAFYIVYVPGGALILLLGAVGLLGDGLRDVLDPRR